MKTLTLVLSLLLLSFSAQAAPWTSGGPRGGRFYAIEAAPSNPRIVYAAGVNGVFRSDDNGDTWRHVGAGLNNVSFIAVDPVDPDTAYFIVGSDFRFLYRTTDGGRSWARVDTGLPGLTRMNTIVIDPVDPRTLYVSSDCGNYLEPLFDGAGVRKSTDGGQTWSEVQRGLNSWGRCALELSIDPATPSHLFLRTGFASGPWESFDGAATWIEAKQPLPTTEVVIDPYQPSVRYGTDGSTILRSDDGGVHWTPQPGAGLPPVLNWTPRMIDLSLDPKTPRIFGATPEGLFRSGDGGRSWVTVGDVPRIRVNAVAFNPVDSTVMIATSAGVYRAPSPAFTPWTQLDVPEAGVSVEDIAVDPHRPNVIYASTNDTGVAQQPQGRIFRSRDGGASWERIGESFRWRTQLTVDASGNLWAAALDSTFLQHVPADSNEVIIGREFPSIQTIAAHPRIGGIVYVGSSGGQMFRTRDGGTSWTPCQYIESRVIEQIALDPSSDTVYVATLGGVYRSTNGCTTFDRLDPWAAVTAIAVAPSNPSVLYRFADKALSRSDDAGTTWTPINLPFPANSLPDIVVDPRDARHLWVPAGGAVSESFDGGMTWRDVTNGLPFRGAGALAIDAEGGTLHAGIASHGVWELSIRRRTRAVRAR